MDQACLNDFISKSIPRPLVELPFGFGIVGQHDLCEVQHTQGLRRRDRPTKGAIRPMNVILRLRIPRMEV